MSYYKDNPRRYRNHHQTLMQNSNISHTFTAIRLPGYHADHSASKGFCFSCNVIYTYLSRIKDGLIRKEDPILIVDIDLHADDRTYEWVKNLISEGHNLYFLNLFCSTQYPWPSAVPSSEYDERHIFNRHLTNGTNIDTYTKELKTSLLLVLKTLETHPNLALISADFDTAKKDKQYLGGHGFNFSPSDYRHLSHTIKTSFSPDGFPKFFSLLEGGYDLSELGTRVSHYLEGFTYQ